MRYSVELYFDPGMEAALQEMRQALGTNPATPADRPHLSLAVFHAADKPALEAQLREFAANVARFPVRLSSVGMFFIPENVLFAAPVPSYALLEVREELHRLLNGLGAQPWSYYRPGEWVPHCTLAMNLAPEAFAERFTQLQRSFRPLVGEVVEVGLVRLDPVERVCAFPLG